MKTFIERGAPVVTLINVFTVDPIKQEALVRVLDEATEKVIKDMRGFVSANIHRSLDGAGGPLAYSPLRRCSASATSTR
jgi:Antibiotic biosynthesis monooxygenase